MHIPSYWSIARLRHETGIRHGITVQRWGWSDSSEQDAQRHAQQRAQQALDTLQRKASHSPNESDDDADSAWIERIENRTEYGLDGEETPIREEVIERRPSLVMTRNSYGARCLNTDNVAIADIDYPSAPKRRIFPFFSLFFSLPSLYAFWAVNLTPLGYVSCSLILLIFLFNLARWTQYHTHQANTPTPVDIAIAWVHALSEKHPDWGLRLYETPKGLRVIVTHAAWTPDAIEVKTLFRELHADPLYAMLCERQNCFRARVSAKPWRIGLRGLSTQARQWPTPAAHVQERQAWVQHYETQSAPYAACRFVTQLGNTLICPPARALIDWHDSTCRAHTTLPLA